MKKYIFSFFLLLTISLHVFSQDIAIRGIVKSAAENEPLIGVSVLMKGATIGTMTDINGEFSLSVPSDAVLRISYIGYESQEFPIGNKTFFNITLSEDSEMMDEIVVVGYGVQKRSVVTAAISKVTSDDLNLTRPSRVEDALKGKVSGVQITQSSGQPGADSKIRIRGTGTINNSDPLYIVDGMPVEGGINFLNPADIESVEILKDAASGAIYGTRAANGVILITTKSGSKEKAVINYDFSYGWQNPWKKKSVLDATQYMTIMNEARINDGAALLYSADQIANAGKGTDWQDETFNYDAPVQNHQVSISGGSESNQYFLSLGYFDQEGIVGGNFNRSNYERWSLRANLNAKVFEATDRKFLNKFTVGVNLGYSRAKSTNINPNSEFGTVLGSALLFDPTIPVYPATEEEAQNILNRYPNAVRDKDGRVFSIPPDGYQEIANPVAMLNQSYKDLLNEDKIVGTFWGELNLLPGLTFKSSYGADLAFWGYDGYEFPYYLSSQGKNSSESRVWSEMNRGYRWQVENVLSYANTFAKKHNLSIVAGQSAQKHTSRRLRGEDYDLPDLDPSKANINSAVADRDRERVDGGVGDADFHSLASYFGRVSYNYDERYMFQGTLRRDGSSHFGKNNKWALFPAVSIGWNVLNEPYLKRPEWFDSFKLRFSWGKNGNENIGNLRYAAFLDSGQNYYFGNGGNAATMSPGTSPGGLANPDLKWEESVQTDIGFDARFLRNALSVTVDYFHKKTNGMLMDTPIPSYVGQGRPIGNVGDMRNQGVEFEVAWSHQVNDFKYTISANASYIKNKLINLGNESGENIRLTNYVGIGGFVKEQNNEVWPFFYGYKTDGLFQNQAEIEEHVNADGELLQSSALPGDVRFVDYNNDGVLDDNDRTKIGKGMPDWTFGFTLSAEWKGFDANVFFQGALGNDIYDISQRGDLSMTNRPSWILDRWHGEGTSNKIPRMTNTNLNTNWRSSDLYVKDGSYLRLKTIQLGYTLPLGLTKHAFIQRLRFYVSAENLLTFTKYDGFDPEVASDGYDSIGVDRGIYPQARVISIGANISF